MKLKKKSFGVVCESYETVSFSNWNSSSLGSVKVTIPNQLRKERFPECCLLQSQKPVNCRMKDSFSGVYSIHDNKSVMKLKSPSVMSMRVTIPCRLCCERVIQFCLFVSRYYVSCVTKESFSIVFHDTSSLIKWKFSSIN